MSFSSSCLVCKGLIDSTGAIIVFSSCQKTQWNTSWSHVVAWVIPTNNSLSSSSSSSWFRLRASIVLSVLWSINLQDTCVPPPEHPAIEWKLTTHNMLCVSLPSTHKGGGVVICVIFTEHRFCVTPFIGNPVRNSVIAKPSPPPGGLRPSGGKLWTCSGGLKHPLEQTVV